jgi:hypothetical protein
MGQQIAIRSDKARELVDRLSERHGKSITAVIEDALQQMDAQDEATRAAEREARRICWHEALEHDRAILRESNVNFEIEDMYDEDGLPC